MSDGISMGLELTHNDFDMLAAQFPEMVGVVVAKTAHDIQADAQDRAPVDLGELKNSIEANQQSPTQWTVDVTADYGPAVEYGAAPHMPPVAALQGWADRHGVDAWALAVAISRRGTDAQPYLTPAAEAHRAAFEAAMEQMLERLK